MFRRLYLLLLAEKKTIIITFQVFWIIVFLLDRLGSPTADEIPQFVYVNF